MNRRYFFLVLLIVLFCGRPEVMPEANYTIIAEQSLPGYAKKVVLFDTLAYVADGQGGLQIVDISVPESLHVIGEYQPDRDVGGVAIRDTFAYLAIESSTSGGLLILNIADPAHPVFVGQDISVYAFDIAAPVDDTLYVYIAASYWFQVEVPYISSVPIFRPPLRRTG